MEGVLPGGRRWLNPLHTKTSVCLWLKSFRLHNSAYCCELRPRSLFFSFSLSLSTGAVTSAAVALRHRLSFGTLLTERDCAAKASLVVMSSFCACNQCPSESLLCTNHETRRRWQVQDRNPFKAFLKSKEGYISEIRNVFISLHSFEKGVPLL